MVQVDDAVQGEAEQILLALVTRDRHSATQTGWGARDLIRSWAGAATEKAGNPPLSTRNPAKSDPSTCRIAQAK
jgi:hypothetical protein